MAARAKIPAAFPLLGETLAACVISSQTQMPNLYIFTLSQKRNREDEGSRKRFVSIIKTTIC